jgi:hypothetical protein
MQREVLVSSSLTRFLPTFHPFRASSPSFLPTSDLCYVMLYYVKLCYVMLCYVVLCYVMLCYVMLCYVMLCYVMLWQFEVAYFTFR